MEGEIQEGNASDELRVTSCELRRILGTRRGRFAFVCGFASKILLNLKMIRQVKASTPTFPVPQHDFPAISLYV